MSDSISSSKSLGGESGPPSSLPEVSSAFRGLLGGAAPAALELKSNRVPSPLEKTALGTQSVDDFSRSFALTTRLDAIVAWGRKNALWPMPYGTACCGIELMSVMGPRYDLARFGAEVVRFSPRQADLLLVAGTITEKMAPILVRIYEQMLDPKYVLSMGACASSGGFYRAYHVLQGADKVIPVDVYVPGCPPTPEAVLDGVMTLQRMISQGQNRPWKENWKNPYDSKS